MFPDGEAVRYRLPEGKRHITGELTEWTLPEDATVWFQPDWMGGIYDETRILFGSEIGECIAGGIAAGG